MAKARLLREDYCDGLGDCLPACPTGAISFEEREAPAYDAAAVEAAKAKKPVLPIPAAAREAAPIFCITSPRRPASRPGRRQPALAMAGADQAGSRAYAIF